jgi:hypothetical protein
MATRKAKPKAPEGFNQKKWEKLSSVWRDGIESKQTEDIKEDIVKAARIINQEKRKMKEDDMLQASMEAVKDRKSIYTEVISDEQNKIDYMLYLMATRGADG